MTLEFLLRRAVRDGSSTAALEAVTTTLDRMAAGGIYDHLGGGFARYSTDERWHVPHFEKMLYDNALLLQLYTRAWQVTGADRYRTVARETAEYLLREMQHPRAASSRRRTPTPKVSKGSSSRGRGPSSPASSASPSPVRSAPRPDGNWTGEEGRTNVLWRPRSIAEVAAETGLDAAELRAEVEDARAVLFAAREAPRAPGDRRQGARRLERHGDRARSPRPDACSTSPTYVDSGGAGRHLRAGRTCATHRGRLLRSWRNGVAGRPGFADDHALMASACLTLFETTFEVAWFDRATELTGELLRLFPDREAAGSSRPAPTPTRCSSARRSCTTTPRRAGTRSQPTCCCGSRHSPATPTFEAEALSALGWSATRSIARRAPSDRRSALSTGCSARPGRSRSWASPSTTTPQALVTAASRRRFRPNLVLAAAAADDADARRAVPLLRDRTAIDGRATAYVCEGFSCRLPVTDPDALADQLGEAFGG